MVVLSMIDNMDNNELIAYLYECIVNVLSTWHCHVINVLQIVSLFLRINLLRALKNLAIRI